MSIRWSRRLRVRWVTIARRVRFFHARRVLSESIRTLPPQAIARFARQDDIVRIQGQLHLRASAMLAIIVSKGNRAPALICALKVLTVLQGLLCQFYVLMASFQVTQGSRQLMNVHLALPESIVLRLERPPGRLLRTVMLVISVQEDHQLLHLRLTRDIYARLVIIA